MKVFHKALLFFTLFLAFQAIAQSKPKCNFTLDEASILSNKNLDAFLQKMEIEKFTTYTDKKAIPAFILKELECISGGFSLVNPKQPYQSGCIMEKGVPQRQLIFLAMSKDIMVMTYATGGMGSSTHFLFVKFSSGKIVDLWTGVGGGKIVHKSVKEIINHINVYGHRFMGLNSNPIFI